MAEQAKTQEQTQEAPLKQISIAEIQDMLNRGLDRKAIAKHYGVNAATMKRIFMHPKLKGKKVKTVDAFELIDDAPEEPKKAEKAPKAGATGSTASGVDTQASANTGNTGTSEQPASQASGTGDTKGVW